MISSKWFAYFPVWHIQSQIILICSFKPSTIQHFPWTRRIIKSVLNKTISLYCGIIKKCFTTLYSVITIKKSLQKYFGCEGVQINEVVKVTSIFQQFLTLISFYSIRLIVFRFDKGVNVCLIRFIAIQLWDYHRLDLYDLDTQTHEYVFQGNTH